MIFKNYFLNFLNFLFKLKIKLIHFPFKFKFLLKKKKLSKTKKLSKKKKNCQKKKNWQNKVIQKIFRNIMFNSHGKKAKSSNWWK